MGFESFTREGQEMNSTKGGFCQGNEVVLDITQDTRLC